MTTRAAVALALASLVLGLAIYLLARDGTHLHALLGVDGRSIDSALPPGVLRAPAAPVLAIALPAFVRDSLPDALWQFAFCATVLVTWRGASGGAAWRALPIAVGLGSELAQGAGLLGGTFDPIDLAAMAVASIVARITIRPSPRQPATARSPSGFAAHA